METTLKRNYSIDVLRVFAALAVVIIHSWFKYKEFFTSFLQFAVPTFFLISGYFLYNPNFEKRKQRLTKALKEITWITIWSSFFYSLVFKHPYINLNDIIGTLSWLKNNYFIPYLYDTHAISGHLWYLTSYINVLVILYIFLVIFKRDINKKTSLLVAALLICNLLLFNLNKYTIKIPVKMCFCGTLFTGLPFVLIGMLIKKYEEKILSLKFVNFRNMAICAVIFSVFALIEYHITHTKPVVYVSTIPQTISYFMAFLLYKMENDNILSKIGREDSLYIYIFHILVINVMFKEFAIPEILLPAASFFDFFVTVLGIRTFRFLHKKLSTK